MGFMGGPLGEVCELFNRLVVHFSHSCFGCCEIVSLSPVPSSSETWVSLVIWLWESRSGFLGSVS